MSWLADRLKIEDSTYDIDDDRTLTANIYGLHLMGLFFGITTAISVVMNYARIHAVQGTYLESHFLYQIRLFWFFLAAWPICIALFAFLGLWWPAGLLAVAYSLGILRGYHFLQRRRSV